MIEERIEQKTGRILEYVRLLREIEADDERWTPKKFQRRRPMKHLSKEEILQFLGAHKQLLHDTFGVTRIGIFGSFAQDRQTGDSDIDIIVELQKDKKNIHTFFHLKRFLEKHLNRKVDLGFETSLRPAIKEKVQKDILYA